MSATHSTTESHLANEIGTLCQQLDVDALAVMQIFMSIPG